MAARRKFPEEVFRTGEPALRSTQGRCVLSRTCTMEKLEAKWHGRALEVTVGGRRPPLSPEEVLAALVA